MQTPSAHAAARGRKSARMRPWVSGTPFGPSWGYRRAVESHLIGPPGQPASPPTVTTESRSVPQTPQPDTPARGVNGLLHLWCAAKEDGGETPPGEGLCSLSRGSRYCGLPRHPDFMLKATLRSWPTWSAYAAAIWSLTYGVLGVYWATGGAHYPFAKVDDDHSTASLLEGTPAHIVAPVIAVVGFLGAAVAIAMTRTKRAAGRPWRHPLLAPGEPHPDVRRRPALGSHRTGPPSPHKQPLPELRTRRQPTEALADTTGRTPLGTPRRAHRSPRQRPVRDHPDRLVLRLATRHHRRVPAR